MECTTTKKMVNVQITLNNIKAKLDICNNNQKFTKDVEKVEAMISQFAADREAFTQKMVSGCEQLCRKLNLQVKGI